MHKAREHQQPLYRPMYFVDFKKAFDSISHDKLFSNVQASEFDALDIC